MCATLVFVETGTRMGAAQYLDVDDYQPCADTPHLRIRHHSKRTPKSSTDLTGSGR
jgi:hypothetical protein